MKPRTVKILCAIGCTLSLFVLYDRFFQAPETKRIDAMNTLCLDLIGRLAHETATANIRFTKSLSNAHAYLSSANIAYGEDSGKPVYVTVACLHPRKQQTQSELTAVLRYLRVSDTRTNGIELHRLAVHQLPISEQDDKFRVLLGDWRRVFSQNPTDQRIRRTTDNND